MLSHTFAQLPHFLPRRLRDRHHDVVDAEVAYQPREVGARPEHRHTLDDGSHLLRIVVDETRESRDRSRDATEFRAR